MCNPCETDADLARAARKARRTYRRAPLVAPTRNCVAIPENTEKVRVHVPPKLIGIEIYDTAEFRRTLNARCQERGMDAHAEGFTPVMTRFLQGEYLRLGFTSCMYAFRALGLVIENLEHCVRPVLSEAKSRDIQTFLYRSVCHACSTPLCVGPGVDAAVRLLSSLPFETIRNLLLRDLIRRMPRERVAETMGVSRKTVWNWLKEIGEQ